MNLSRVLVALLSLNQDYIYVARLQGPLTMAKHDRTIRINHGSFRRAIIKAKADAIVFHDQILTGRRNLKVGMNENHPLVADDE